MSNSIQCDPYFSILLMVGKVGPYICELDIEKIVIKGTRTPNNLYIIKWRQKKMLSKKKNWKLVMPQNIGASKLFSNKKSM